jgi:hypothetical protein
MEGTHIIGGGLQMFRISVMYWISSHWHSCHIPGQNSLRIHSWEPDIWTDTHIYSLADVLLWNYSNIYQTRCNITQFILSGNYSTCFGWYHHPKHVEQFIFAQVSHSITVLFTSCK